MRKIMITAALLWAPVVCWASWVNDVVGEVDEFRFFLSVAINILLVVVLAAYFIISQRKQKELKGERDYWNNEYDKVAEYRDELTEKLNVMQQQLKIAKGTTEQENPEPELINESRENGAISISSSQDSPPVESQALPLPEPEPEIIYKYLKSISGSTFRKESNDPEGAYYRLYDENERAETAKFDFCGDSKMALATPDANVYNFCDFRGNLNNFHEIYTSAPGTLKRIDGVWTVIKKVQITPQPKVEVEKAAEVANTEEASHSLPTVTSTSVQTALVQDEIESENSASSSTDTNTN
jgi:hypothetical protein